MMIDTSNGFSRYNEMDANNLFIDNDLARRWHKENRLMTTVYMYDKSDLIGWAAIQYMDTPKDYAKYGKVNAGYIGVFVKPEYRSSGIATQLLAKLKNSIDISGRTPIGKYMDKYKKRPDMWNIIIQHMGRISGMVHKVFSDINPYGDPKYSFVEK